MSLNSPAGYPAPVAMLALCAMLLAGCGTHTPENATTMATLKPFDIAATPQDWQALTQMKIAFGHQSVGADVIAGIEILARQNNSPLTVAESKAPFTAPALHHFKIGRNEAPHTKLQAFKEVMAGGVGVSADVALMKLCYIDFNASTKPAQLAQSYITELEKLSAQYPNTSFVAVTAPLTSVQTGPKALIKKILGNSPGGYEDNAHRKVFNETLRAHYANNERLFDIAAIESGFGKSAIEHHGQRIETLDPALTYDGGHLNEAGKRLIGGALVHHLAEVSRLKALGGHD